MRSRRTARTVVVLGLAAAAVAVAAAGGLGVGLLHLAPALAMFAALLARRYPGERHVVALVTRSRRARSIRRRTPLVLVTPRPSRSLPRGGLLVAAALAERGPPRVHAFS